MTDLVTAPSDNVKTLGTGLSPPVNCVYITVRMEATIWEWWAESKPFKETAIYIWKGRSCERKGDFFSLPGIYALFCVCLLKFVSVLVTLGDLRNISNNWAILAGKKKSFKFKVYAVCDLWDQHLSCPGPVGLTNMWTAQ